MRCEMIVIGDCSRLFKNKRPLLAWRDCATSIKRSLGSIATMIGKRRAIVERVTRVIIPGGPSRYRIVISKNHRCARWYRDRGRRKTITRHSYNDCLIVKKPYNYGKNDCHHSNPTDDYRPMRSHINGGPHV